MEVGWFSVLFLFHSVVYSLQEYDFYVVSKNEFGSLGEGCNDANLSPGWVICDGYTDQSGSVCG